MSVSPCTAFSDAVAAVNWLTDALAVTDGVEVAAVSVDAIGAGVATTATTAGAGAVLGK